jgi:hypothetical protein
MLPIPTEAFAAAGASGEPPAVQPLTANVAAATPDNLNTSLREIAIPDPFLIKDSLIVTVNNLKVFKHHKG